MKQRKQPQMFGVYHQMERAGIFADNPNNRGAIDDDGRDAYVKAQFPQMVYHPEGLHRITVPAEVRMTPFGPEKVGEHTELINKTVKNQQELDAAMEEGWWLSPNKAEAKGKGEPIPETLEEKLARLESENAELRAAKEKPVDDEGETHINALAAAKAAGATIVSHSVKK